MSYFIVEFIILLPQMLWEFVRSGLRLVLPVSWIAKSVVGERVLITGAGGGLGYQIATEFARKGAELVLWDINDELNSKTADAVEELGAKVTTFKCDISKRDEVYCVAERVKKEVGEIDILVNNAGIVSGKRLMDIPDERIIKTMEINSLAHVWTLKAFLPHMMAKNHGHIVTIASIAGNFGLVRLSDYCMSKFAAQGFHESMALEMVAEGATDVKFTVVNPYLITTGMFDGVKIKYPFIIPSLAPEQVGRKVVNAVLTNQEVVVLPWSMNLFVYLKSFMPIQVLFMISKLFGVLHSMDEFVGRSKKD
ncbi:epidermal retinol dehydrogenase 2-like [Anneissia japonica]|uniref:epidermal retinol dehydrogenase 2-like n=1 Tax=Anneissia japonica TaxID=1529436 RepID=UPI001425A3DA|nr:epidermal retinol dehydrogenase 2-like [Anneissia japonica]